MHIMPPDLFPYHILDSQHKIPSESRSMRFVSFQSKYYWKRPLFLPSSISISMRSPSLGFPRGKSYFGSMASSANLSDAIIQYPVASIDSYLERHCWECHIFIEAPLSGATHTLYLPQTHISLTYSRSLSWPV